jgi:hypothetical protein
MLKKSRSLFKNGTNKLERFSMASLSSKANDTPNNESHHSNIQYIGRIKGQTYDTQST